MGHPGFFTGIGFGRKNYLQFCTMGNWFRARKLPVLYQGIGFGRGNYPVLYQGIGFGRGNYQFCTQELEWRTKKKKLRDFLVFLRFCVLG